MLDRRFVLAGGAAATAFPAQAGGGARLLERAIVRAGGSLGDVVSQMAVSLEARSRTVVPWCEGP